MKQNTVRFEDDDMHIVESAAKVEGLDTAPFIRRCTLLYIRETYPELFKEGNSLSEKPTGA